MNQSIDLNIELIERCKQGDIKAQFSLYKRYSGAMYNIAVRFLNNKMDTEDILQESFITVFSRLNELKRNEAFGSWLKRIVINNCISFLRKNRMHFEDIDNHKLPDEDFNDVVEEEIDPAIVHNAIKQLPEGARTIVILYALENYKHREIADLLKISESTSKTQYKRALDLLSKNLITKSYVN